MTLNPIPAITALGELLSLPEGSWSLADGAVAIARLRAVGPDEIRVLSRLATLGERAREHAGDAVHPRFATAAIARALFDEAGLRVPARGEESPSCLYIDEVLERGSGTATLLAIVFVEVARRTGRRYEIIALPGTVLLRHDFRGAPHLFDPAREARPVSIEECRRTVSGGKGEFREAWLRPLGREQVLARLLGGLKALYWRIGNYDGALAAIRMLLAIRADDPREIRDSGRLLFLLGRYQDAIGAFESYLQVNPHGEDADAVRMLLLEARAGLNG